jgi:hypothetical protein
MFLHALGINRTLLFILKITFSRLQFFQCVPMCLTRNYEQPAGGNQEDSSSCGWLWW